MLLASKWKSHLNLPSIARKKRLKTDKDLASDGGGFAGEFGGDVVVDEGFKGESKFVVGAFEGDVFLAVDVDGAARSFACAGKADADVGGFGFARAVDDAAHDCESHGFDAVVLRFPRGHHFADVGLGAFGEFLEGRAGGAATAGAGGYARRKRAQAERLKNFAACVNFFAAIAAGARRERNANRVADAVVEKNAERSGGPDLAFHTHASFGEAEMQRLLGFAT